jgi:hypothetical protein
MGRLTRALSWTPVLAAVLSVGLGGGLGCAAEVASGPSPTRRDSGPVRVAPTALRVAVLSDLNGGYGARTYGAAVHAAVDRLVEAHPDLVLSTGDMVAGQRGGLDYDGMWTSFHAAVSDRLAADGIPFAVTPGNHDASGYPSFTHERSIYVAEWERRRPDVALVDDSHYPLRYSFTAGPAFFVSLDATTIGPLAPEQMEWLDEQLGAAPQPVKIVFGHVPLHPFTEGRAGETIGDPALEAMLARHGVALFVSGHHHAYYPGRRGALRLVSTACLGGGPRPLLGTHARSERSLLTFEVRADGIHELDAWAGEAFDRPIDRATLPEHVGVGARRIERDDLGEPFRISLR